MGGEGASLVCNRRCAAVHDDLLLLLLLLLMGSFERAAATAAAVAASKSRQSTGRLDAWVSNMMGGRERERDGACVDISRS